MSNNEELWKTESFQKEDTKDYVYHTLTHKQENGKTKLRNLYNELDIVNDIKRKYWNEQDIYKRNPREIDLK